MTTIVDPSSGRTAKARRVAEAIRLAGHTSGWIAPSDTEFLAGNEGLSGAPLNAFEATSSSSSLTVTFDTGEAFIGGSWLAKDTTTDVTLEASTAAQEIYIGWSATGADTVIMGPVEDFGTYDRRILVYTFDTDASGVTSETDKRPIGKRFETINTQYDSDSSGVVDDAEDAQALGGNSPDVVFRDVVTISMGVSRLETDEKHRQLDRVPGSKTWKLLAVSMMNAVFGAEPGAYVRVFDSGGNEIYSQNGQKYVSGTVENPLATLDGPEDIEIWLENQVDGTRRYSARLSYILE